MSEGPMILGPVFLYSIDMCRVVNTDDTLCYKLNSLQHNVSLYHNCTIGNGFGYEHQEVFVSFMQYLSLEL